MSYIKESLLKDESIIYYSKPAFVIFYTVFIWIALAIFMFKFTGSKFIGGFMTVMVVASIVDCLTSYFCTEYVITNKRVLMKVGFIGRRSLEIFINRLEGIYVIQGVFGRILNFGTIIIIGVGGTKNPFFYIPNPLEFRASVQRQMQDSGSGKQ